MSIFHVHEWLTLELSDANICAVGELIEKRDQIIVGSVTGRLWLIDPGRVNDTKQQLLNCLLEEDLSAAILDIAIAKFIPDFEQNLIAILLPHKLMLYRLVSNGEVYQLNTIHEHKISSTAYNMCIGTFGRAIAPQLCVQDMTCSLMVFEGEHQLFHRSVNLANALHPGPILYTHHTDSIIIASSSAILISYRYSVLATASSSGKSGKKIIANWTFNLGDYPLDLEMVDTSFVQPSIIILCKRTIYSLTHGGTLRFTYRLQCVATSLLVYESTPDAYVKLCIATATRMLLFFKDTILIWAAQLLHDVIQVQLCTFSTTYRSMLVILSNSRLSICYLGTEPSLYRLPAPQIRFIDFQQRYREFVELEALIRKKPLESSAEGITRENSLSMNCTYNGLDSKLKAEKSSMNIPSLTLNIELVSEIHQLDVKLICSTEFHTEHKYISFPTIDGLQKISTDIYVHQQPVNDLRCKLYAFSIQSGDVINKELKLPLNLMCHTVSAQRNAQYKLTIESSLNVLDLAQLFPEFETESTTAIAFQPYLSETIISIYASRKYKRYRIQTENLNFIYLFADELIARIKAKQPDAIINCILPLDEIIQEINKYFEYEKRKIEEEKELERCCTLLRNVQAVILTKLKSERPAEIDHMNTLLNYTYEKVLNYVDRIEQLNETLHSASLSLSSALNLINLKTSLTGNQLPLDGTIVNNSGQSILERIKWAISTFKQIDLNIDLSANDLRNILQNVCEGNSTTMPHIVEASKEDEEEDDDNDKPEQSELIMNPLISGLTISDEFNY